MRLLPASLLVATGSALAAGVATTPKCSLGACALIAKAVSPASSVFLPGSPEYASDMVHFAANAETNATCSVQPGTAADVGKALAIIGACKTPFAIKGGGHNLNPGFASTTGVQLTMTRFNKVVYDAKANTAEVGAGLIWDDVYRNLEPHGVGVVGGRATGVGVAGYLLGGGYSYKTNQYGLGVDNVVAVELVLPSGEVKCITHKSDPDLFFAVRGGGNNFGIVTKFTLKTHPQPQVWGGSLTYDSTQVDAVTSALVNFTKTSKDPKSGLQCTYATLTGQQIVMVNIFYNAPTPPAGMFDAFLAIPSAANDVSSRSYLSMILSANTNITAGFRGVYNTISHKSVPVELTTAVRNETSFFSAALAGGSFAANAYGVVCIFVSQRE
ncbi:NAD(P)-binding protein [Mycena kentingensis (nom. inval.)]|nr:NAD(P)-binding protein [Mycena kentingensis (nom. inval.)]